MTSHQIDTLRPIIRIGEDFGHMPSPDEGLRNGFFRQQVDIAIKAIFRKLLGLADEPRKKIGEQLSIESGEIPLPSAWELLCDRSAIDD